MLTRITVHGTGAGKSGVVAGPNGLDILSGEPVTIPGDVTPPNQCWLSANPQSILEYTRRKLYES
jgi:hypothetical protein